MFSCILGTMYRICATVRDPLFYYGILLPNLLHYLYWRTILIVWIIIVRLSDKLSLHLRYIHFRSICENNGRINDAQCSLRMSGRDFCKRLYKRLICLAMQTGFNELCEHIIFCCAFHKKVCNNYL